MNAYIVDNEKFSRETLKKLIELSCPGVEIVGESYDHEHAVNYIPKHEIDILFLDIGLGDGKSGFSVLDELPGFSAAVIFLTGFSEFALKAFRYNAVDYLTKPLDIKALENAVQKAKVFNAGRNQNRDNRKAEELQRCNTLVLPFKNSLEILKTGELLYAEGSGSYTVLHLQHEKTLQLSKNLKHFEAMLPDTNEFMRIHKSYIANTRYFSAFLRTESLLHLNTGIRLPVSKAYKNAVLDFFER